MIALTYHSPLALHWRGRFIEDIALEDRERCAADATLRLLDSTEGEGAGGLGDGRLVMHASTADAFATPSQHGVLRNVRFVEAPFVANHFLDGHTLGGARVQQVMSGVVSPDVRKMMNFVSKPRNFISNTRNFVFKMMNFVAERRRSTALST